MRLLFFIVFCKEVEEDYFENQYYILTDKRRIQFINDCNALLDKCGMARLYPANAFDNLLMIALRGDVPRDIFDEIFYHSFDDVIGELDGRVH